MANIINPANTIFVLLTFEGPDRYSLIGGLGIRMTEVSNILSRHGYTNHMFFVGDPYAESFESHGPQNFHRWCQWISMQYPGGVYDGEDRKINEWNRSVPNYIITEIVIPAARKGMLTVVLAEDWHTAQSAVILDRRLRELNLRDHCVVFWNVNNEYGFGNINLQAVNNCCSITTVSKYMSRRMTDFYGISAAAIPNGIPERIIRKISDEDRSRITDCFEGVVLQKTGRYDPNKCWLQAVKAMAQLKAEGRSPHLLMRGGLQEHRYEVIKSILENHLSYVSIKLQQPSIENITQAFRRYRHFDVIEMDFFLPEEFMMLLYGATHAVLANSSYEPFGIVGLEVMAKEGIAIVGNTGEDYAVHGKNAMRVKTQDPAELANLIKKVHEDESLKTNLRKNALLTAKEYTWDKVLGILIANIEKVLCNYNLAKAGNSGKEGKLLVSKYN